MSQLFFGVWLFIFHSSVLEWKTLKTLFHNKRTSAGNKAF